MNIMFFAQAAWDDKNASGNTISNFFCGEEWKDDYFSCFYTRKQLPDNKAQVDYYNLSAIDIVKGILKFKVKGSRFSSDEIKHKRDVDSQDSERKMIDKVHNKKNDVIYYFHELIWRSKIWLNRYFKQFVEDHKPDILFAFCTSPYILLPLIRYLKKNTNCKVVLFIADDVYGQYDYYPVVRKSYFKRYLSQCIYLADLLYGISSEMCQRYQQIFNKEVKFLTKGCDLSVPPKEYLNNPLRIVYAGNLLYGRELLLSKLADTLEYINQNEVKAVLEIYTNATITPDLNGKLNKGSSSKIMGVRPYDEIMQIMHDADICLHVESFEEESKASVRYSFSTKITDCLQSGNQLLAIGPSGIASIEYCKKIPGAIVIDNLGKMRDAITNMLENRMPIEENCRKIRQFAEKCHSLNVIQHNLHDDFLHLIKGPID